MGGGDLRAADEGERSVWECGAELSVGPRREAWRVRRHLSFLGFSDTGGCLLINSREETHTKRKYFKNQIDSLHLQKHMQNMWSRPG